MDQQKWYYRYRADVGWLNQHFTDIENAFKDEILSISENTGVVTGFTVSERAAGPDFSVDVSSGTAFDSYGNRLKNVQTVNVPFDTDVDENDIEVVGVGNERIVSVYAYHTKIESQPQVDGFGDVVNTRADDGAEYVLIQGAEAAIGAAVAAANPNNGGVLIANVTITNGDNTVENAEIDTTVKDIFKVFIQENNIGEDEIDFGSNPGQVDATSIPIIDPFGYYGGANVEAALQEAGQLINQSILDIDAAQADATQALANAAIADGKAVAAQAAANAAQIDADAAQADIDAHEAAADPHTQYLERDGSDFMTGELHASSGIDLGGSTLTLDAAERITLFGGVGGYARFAVDGILKFQIEEDEVTIASADLVMATGHRINWGGDSGAYIEETANNILEFGVNNTARMTLNGTAVTTDLIGIVGDQTTADILEITGNSLTTGRIAHLYSNSASSSVRQLLRVHNDNSLADGTTCAQFTNDAGGAGLSISVTNASDTPSESFRAFISGNNVFDIAALTLTASNSGAGYGIGIDMTSVGSTVDYPFKLEVFGDALQPTDGCIYIMAHDGSIHQIATRSV